MTSPDGNTHLHTNDTGFYDSRWKSPILHYDPWSPPAEFHPKAEKIWSGDGGSDNYCRTDRLTVNNH